MHAVTVFFLQFEKRCVEMSSRRMGALKTFSHDPDQGRMNNEMVTAQRAATREKVPAHTHGGEA